MNGQVRTSVLLSACLVPLLTATALAQGVNQIKDINPGPSIQSNIVGIGIHVVFAANTVKHAVELWRSDGTPQGTVMVRDIYPGGSSRPRNLVGAQSQVFFVADTKDQAGQLFSTDGLTVTQASNINAGKKPATPQISWMTAVGDTLFFRAWTPTSGWELYASDGKKSWLVKDIRPGKASSSPQSLVAVGKTLYFQATTPNNGRQLMKSDGTAAGTIVVKAIRPGGTILRALTRADGRLFFLAQDVKHGLEPWISDGTAAGTKMIRDIVPGTGAPFYNEHAVWFDGFVYFGANSGNGAGGELWRTDGTEKGTVMFKDLEPGAVSGNPMHFMATNEYLYFVANSAATNVEPWRTDGTSKGTIPLGDLWPGLKSSGIKSFFAAGSRKVVFAAQDGKTGIELYLSDGTKAGTRMVANIRPEKRVNVAEHSMPANFGIASGIVFFSADDGKTGRELWGYKPGAAAVEAGSGCAKGGNPPRLRGTDPRLGSTLKIKIDSSTPNTKGVLAIGFQQSPPRSIGSCCTLYIQPLMLLGFATDANGNAALNFPVGNNKSLIGLTMALQAAIGPTGQLPWGLDLSNGLVLTIGN